MIKKKLGGGGVKEVHYGICESREFPSSLVPQFQNKSKCKTDFDLSENELVGGTRFHTNSFALTGRLVLTQRQKATRK